jgi:uncharacterized protein (DUF983 family)
LDEWLHSRYQRQDAGNLEFGSGQDSDRNQIMTEDKALYAPIDPFKAGVTCACPRCGQGKLYDGLLKVRPTCMNCGLDYSFADSGDGPAVFVIMIIGFIVVGLALWTEINLSPPLWLHFIIWIPLAIVLSLWLLRVLKSVLIALQYRNNAKQGEIDRG